MRRFAVVVNAVAGAEDFLMLAYLHHKVTFNNDVALLSRMGGQLDVASLRLLTVNALNVKRLRNTLLEIVRQIVVGHAVSIGNLLSRAAAGNRVGFQLWAVPLYNIGNIYLQRKRAAVNKRKVKVVFSVFAVEVFADAYTCAFCHILRRKAFNLTQFADTSRHFLNL